MSTTPTWPPVAFHPVPDGAPTTPPVVQVTVDCDDPHAQARFWAAALGYRVEDTHDLVEAVLAAGYADRDRDTVEVDGRLAWRTMSGIQPPDGVDGSRLLFVAVPDRNPGKNSWHLDLTVGRDRIDAEVARLTALGAEERHRVSDNASHHTTMADPEGNLFDVQ